MTTKFRLYSGVAALMVTLFTQQLAIAMVTGQSPVVATLSARA